MTNTAFFISGLFLSTCASATDHRNQIQFGEEDSPSPIFSYQKKSRQKKECPYCHKTLSHSHCLVNHIRIHTGERPYVCKVCLKAFAALSNMKQHTLMHSGIKPYQCTVCDYSANRMSNLKKHMSKH